MLKCFRDHRVLDDLISDHQPTITRFTDRKLETSSTEFKKINWPKFKESLTKSSEITPAINTIEEIDLESSKITEEILEALKKSTVSFNVNSKATIIQPIPLELLNLVKLKKRLVVFFKKQNQNNTRNS